MSSLGYSNANDHILTRTVILCVGVLLVICHLRSHSLGVSPDLNIKVRKVLQ